MNPKSLKLTPHANGKYCKRINGKLMYFGWKGCTEEQARQDLIKYLAGIAPQAAPDASITISQAFSEYALDCENRVKRGELDPKTFDEYDLFWAPKLSPIGALGFRA